MAVSQVRAQFNGQWYTLTYNEQTRRYEAEITPSVHSGGQPDGRFNVTVEATNDTGSVSTTDGNTFAGLLVDVYETIKPTVTVVSPPPGYITNSTPTVTFSAVDNEGGSGINPSTAVATLDSDAAPSDQVSITAGSGGAYTIVYTPLTAISDGAHQIVLTISDNDGNSSSATAEYVIDTTPPELSVLLSFEEVVTDEYTVEITGHASDVTANPVTVTVKNNDGDPVSLSVESTKFSHVLDLAVGENNIVVTATDAAGLTTTREYYVIRLITDRTQSDVDRVLEITQKIAQGTATTDEQNEWFSGMRGSYNAVDLNRVNIAMEYIHGWIEKAGYASDYVEQGIVWDIDDIQTQEQMQGYLNNVDALGSVFPIENPPDLPSSIVFLTFIGANSIEKVLVQTDKIKPLLDRSPFISGEIYCGEV